MPDVLEYPGIRRGGRTVLHAGALSLPPGDVVGLIGINGAGKSTLMMHMAGVLRNARRPLHAKAPEPARTRAGYAPQQACLPGWLKTDEVARLFGCTMDILTASFAGLLLGELRDTRISMLSVGQLQALSIAVALAADAPVVLLDEPFAPLDFRRRIGLTAILQRRHADRTVVISTQSAAELLDVCDRVVVLRDGRCVWEGEVIALSGGEEAMAGESRVRVLERRLLSLLDGDSSQASAFSASRTPFACHPR